MLNKPDRTLLFIVFALIIFGLIMIASAGIVYSESRFGDNYYFFKHQFFFGALPGLAVMMFLGALDYRIFKKLSPLIYFGAMIALILVFIPGVGSSAYGASRWVQLGSFSFQPAEMMKLAIILYLAAWFSGRQKNQTRDTFEGLIPYLIIVSIAAFLILQQPNVGTAGIILIISLVMFFVAGGKPSHIAGLVLAGVAGLFVLIKIAPYRLNRFLVFMNPDIDPQGIGYQIKQALIALGSGGILGVGLGHSRQKFNYLPEPVGDSIFAIIGEELGLAGCLVLIALFIFLAFLGYRIAKKAPDDFGRLVAAGITSWIVIQAFINMAAISGLMPLTGIPLPFISYGGTSIVFLLAGIGILLNIAKKGNN